MRRLILFLWAASGILAQGQNISPGVPSVYRGYRLDAAQVDTVLSETVLTKVELLQKRQMPTATAKSTVSAHRSSAAQTRSAIPKSFSPNQSKLVGEIPINEGVSPMGARTYTVPVQVAPGIKGVQPSLSLSYNSMGGDGCLGKGWNISGLSAIVRGNQSIYYDGKTQGAENAKHDAFYLDGMRLIRIGSSTSKNTYQSEQGHIKAEGYLSGSCVKYFKVYYPNGSIAVMGYSNNSSHKSVFPITQIQDKNSNVMDYAYDNVYNNYRIKAINYGKNGSKPHFATVEFHYITRSDYSFAWHGGLKTENRDLLSRITCTGSSTHLTSYAFSYTGQHHQLLEQINCAVNGSSLNPLRFYYGGEQQRAKFEKSSTQLVSYFNSSATGSLDLKKGKFDAWSDDDGLIVRPHKAAYKEYYQSGSLFSHSKRWYRNMMHSEQELLVYFDLASSWAHPQKVKAGKGFIDMFAADIDGKAGDEVIKTRLYPNGSKDYIIFEVYRPAPVSSGVAIAPDYTRTFSAPTALDWYGTKSPHPRFFYPGDYNGDGRMEILVVTCYGPFERTSVKSTCYLYDLHNNKKLYEGQVFDFKAGFAGASISDALFPLDYNGDGKMDICHINSSGTHIYSFTSSGSSVSALRKISTYSGLNSAHLRHKHFKVGEFNGDGKADFLLSPKASYSRYETHSIPLHLPRRCYCCSSEHPIEPPVTAAGDSNGRFRCKYCDCPLPTSSKCYECSRPLTHDLYTKRYRCSHHGTMTTIRVSKYISLGKSWTIYHSKGNGYFDKKTMDVCNRDEDDKYELVDMNGDGTTDLVSRKASGALTIYPARQGLISGTALSGYESIGYGGYLVPSDISQGKYHSKLLALKDDKIHKVAYTIDESAQGLLTTAVSSFGIASKTHYARMNSGEYTPSPLYIKGYSAVFPYQDFSGPLYLTSETQSWNGNSKIAHQSFTYREALLHRQGLGLRGFKRIDTYDGISGAYTYAYYDPTRFGVMTKTVTQESTTTYRYSTWTSYNKIANIRLNSRRIEDKLKGNTITQTYSYDGYGNPIRETIYYDGNTRTFTELSYFNNTSLRNYILGIPKEKKVSKTSGSDTFVEKTKWVYSNSKGQPYSITRYHNDEQAGQVHYAYDRFGNVTSETRKPYSSAHALRTRYTYSSDGRFLTESTNPMGQKTSFTRNARGEISQKKNFKGHSTMYEYDALGRVKSVQHPSGERQFTLYRWDTSEEKSLYTIRSTSNTAPTQISYYDAMGRIVQTASLELSGWVYTYTEYDSQGRLYRSSLPTRDKTKRWVTTTYDRYNRPVRINEASGAVTSYQYKGNSVTASKNGRTSTQTTNARGDLIRATDPGGTITYSIRGDGQAAFVVAPGGVKTSFVYDKHGRKIKMTDPSAGTITYAYDAAGNLKSQTNANNKTTTFSYDPYNRLTKEVRPELSSTYTYNTNGLLSTVHSNNGTKISYSYNNLLQLQTVSESIDGRSYSEDYTYDSSGRRASTTYSPMDYTLTYSYNRGTLSQIKGNGEQLWQLKHQDAYGYATQQNYGNGISDIKGYDAYGYLMGQASLPTHSDHSQVTSMLQSFGYAFDRTSGNLKSRKDYCRNLSEHFTYDNLDRLCSTAAYYGSTPSLLYKEHMQYRDNGNLKKRQSLELNTNMAYHYGTPYKPYALSSLSDVGKQIPAHEQAISYTSFQRPRLIEEGGNMTHYEYNAAHQRILSVSNINYKTDLRYNFGGGKYQDINDCQGLRCNRVQRLYLGGSPYTAFAVLEKKNNESPKLYYLHRDYLGSVTLITDSRGRKVAEYSYTAWGRMRYPDLWLPYPVGEEPLPLFERGYTGHEHLPAFGLINMNARLYDPALGRFLSPDPYVQAPDFSQNFNRYSYCLNNPLRYTDPSGEYFIIDDLIAAAIGGVINLVVNAVQGNLSGHGVWEGIGRGFAAFGAGAVGGFGALYPEFGGWLWGGATVGATNAWLGGATTGQEILIGAGVGAIAGVAGGAAGQWGGQYIGGAIINGAHITSPVLQGAVTGAAGGAVGGYVGGFTGGLIMTGDVKQANQAGISGLWTGAAVGGVVGGGAAYKYAVDNKISPWNGKPLNVNKLTQPQYDFTPDQYGDNVTMYRGTTGSEGKGGPLFMTDNPEYAATYVKNGGQVVEVTIPRSTYLQMYQNGHIQPYQGVHNGSYGYEYQIHPSVAPDLLKLFKF